MDSTWRAQVATETIDTTNTTDVLSNQILLLLRYTTITTRRSVRAHRRLRYAWFLLRPLLLYFSNLFNGIISIFRLFKV